MKRFLPPVLLLISLVLYRAERCAGQTHEGVSATAHAAPRLRALAPAADQDYFCFVRIAGKHPRCFIPVGYRVPRPPEYETKTTVLQLSTDEEITAEMATGMLLFAELSHPGLVERMETGEAR